MPDNAFADGFGLLWSTLKNREQMRSILPELLPRAVMARTEDLARRSVRLSSRRSPQTKGSSSSSCSCSCSCSNEAGNCETAQSCQSSTAALLFCNEFNPAKQCWFASWLCLPSCLSVLILNNSGCARVHQTQLCHSSTSTISGKRSSSRYNL